MKPPFTADQTVTFFRRLGSKQTLAILYLIDHFGPIFVADLAAATKIPNTRMVNLSGELRDLGILTKTALSGSPGKLVSVSINPDLVDLIKPYLSRLGEDPYIASAIQNYQHMKDTHQLLGDKYGV